ncbi:tetratricopeptide repeat protein [Marispirochaeta sp.]|uniref:tetratricopeptide repeat protein n=1 Tax=Marispirochaeta sp. TaxID=2038653 RepID=UPI0029C95CBF|nr:tetratricopeptide repeat protein [Marispirochaeta sp.]
MENQEKLKLGARIAQWIQKRKKVLLIALAGILTILLVLGILNGISSAKSKKAIASLIEFEEIYSQWNNAATEKRRSIGEDVEQIFSEIEKDYSGTYAHQRGLFMMGDFYYKNEEWANSSEKYLALAAQYERSYLAPIALYNAAAAFEELGEIEKARENYRRISSEYPNTALAPRSIFSFGRLEEQKSEDDAVNAYNELIERYPQSNWTKLARSRIIELNISN